MSVGRARFDRVTSTLTHDAEPVALGIGQYETVCVVPPKKMSRSRANSIRSYRSSVRNAAGVMSVC